MYVCIGWDSRVNTMVFANVRTAETTFQPLDFQNGWLRLKVVKSNIIFFLSYYVFNILI
ncbi:hypothetical protein Hanom_Chr07g00646121 [Helianthus anomalus]